MKKMIKNLCGVFLITAVVIMPLDYMAFEEAGKAIDEYIATLPAEQQAEYQRNLAELEDPAQLEAAMKEFAVEMSAKRTAKEAYLLNAIVRKVKDILDDPLEWRSIDQKILASLMEDLDGQAKNAIQDDIEIIQKVVGKGLFRDAHNAYRHLQCVVADRIAQLTGIDTRSRMQRAIDYVSRKIEETKRAVRFIYRSIMHSGYNVRHTGKEITITKETKIF